MPIQAFIDDSGVKGQGRFFVFGGLMSEAETWFAFSDAWKTTLQDEGLERYKMDDAVKRYKRAPGDEDRRMRQFIGLINKYPVRAFYCAVEWKPFDDVGGGTLQKPYRDLYLWPFITTIEIVCRELLLAGETERSEIIFDEHRIFAPRMQEHWPAMRQLFPVEFQSVLPTNPLFRTDDEFMPLQAADLIAGLVRLTAKLEPFPFEWIWQAMPLDKWSPYSEIAVAERWQRWKRMGESFRARIANGTLGTSTFDLEFDSHGPPTAIANHEVEMPGTDGEGLSQAPVEDKHMKPGFIDSNVAETDVVGYAARALYFNCNLVLTGRQTDDE